ncbi:AzlD domain-containing protein [Vibrio sp. SCSIO 43136]|uniref:AzlD domain-containing protein n=1 Tax=Vibrio sp. SCSIO 43136 TaxID=2819101 RepID=UPI0020750F11|nr:AzlD domain-containing protein [Vibrio sp. SCSIO 43136]USD67882.1 AzlD domain-containing protein [Vibrio sp. SCSIO 43136]
MNYSEFFVFVMGIAISTFAIRFSILGFAGSFEMSPRLKKTLRFVPITVLPAIIAVEVLGTAPEVAFHLHNPKLLAAIVATIISLRFDLVWVVISGVGSLLIFQNILA